ncbi:MAG TPA: SET domain-containing protein-lysine N-methyltransferase [Flavipsychrobacter sp.]|nr:SET domain-containing protein-lysine N-methyltransferase [Flavipsychrobacter sp.]
MLFYEIYMQETAGKGRGMYALEAIPAGKVIETAPVIVMSASDRTFLDKTLLHDYIFEWQPNGENLCCMALGYVPIYNHSYQSNCEYFMDYESQTISIKTVKAILPAQELTINYNGDWNDDKKIWFDAL